jgi:hypothetical protein
MHIINYGGKTYVYPDSDNFKEQERVWFLVKASHTSNMSMDVLEPLSHVYIHVKYMKAVYDPDIMKQLSSIWPRKHQSRLQLE